MFTTINAEPTLWDGLLPEVALRLPPGLAEIDRLLDDERFFEPFRAFFDPRHGRPSIPMETYLRMMFLRFRYKLGFETLCAEVSDSIAWRRFCRVPLDTPVPHPSTLIKITARCGTAAIDGLNEVLLAKAAEEKLVRLDRVRADTTVVEANVAYPTDSGLLAKAIITLVGLVGVLKAAGLPAGPGSGIVGARRDAWPMKSGCGYAAATTTLKTRCSRSPAVSPFSPKRP